MTSVFARLAAAATALMLAAVPAAALQITMLYDDVSPSDGAPFVGTGVLTLGSDPGNGSFAWTGLDTPSLVFTFPGAAVGGADLVLTEADASTDLTLLDVILSGAGDVRAFRFDSDEGGFAGGSLDLRNTLGTLSHQPGGGSLYFARNADLSFDVFGEFVPGGEAGAPVPLPAAGWLLAAGFAGLAGLRRARRRA
ncbi:MAG TPA: VPLPA-CTERM sorting domain-containing protein [Paracoccaceae bacterium]|nr:VPLPA-CTERM sorting domain-containing protein [Paracoccaceae bacterium]